MSDVDNPRASFVRAREARRQAAYLFAVVAIGIMSAAGAFWLYGEEYKYQTTFQLLAGFAGLSAVSTVAIVMNTYLRYGQLNPFAVAHREQRIATGEAPEPKRNYTDTAISAVSAVSALSAGLALIKGRQDEEPELPSAPEPTDVQSRLAREVRMQDLKANLNLIMGSVGALIAFAVLGFSIYSPPRETGWEFGAVAGARVMLSITASVFAFFFLSTYRRNLSEIRYFHNELTNVQLRMQALERHKETIFTDAGKSEAAFLKMLTSLVETERNFILKKGESTTDLYQKDLDKQEYGASLDFIVKALKEAQAAEPKKGTF